jgi:carboxypeptidase Taq
MVRYEIEKMIFNNPGLKSDDLPALWNEKMQEYLGIIPENDADGVLQDVHWSLGLFGYFPSYAIGNAYAAQIWNFMEKDLDLNNAIRTLDFKSINLWLTEKIHKHGALLEPSDILSQITSEDFTSKYYINYIKRKYTGIYNL